MIELLSFAILGYLIYLMFRATMVLIFLNKIIDKCLSNALEDLDKCKTMEDYQNFDSLDYYKVLKDLNQFALTLKYPFTPLKVENFLNKEVIEKNNLQEF